MRSGTPPFDFDNFLKWQSDTYQQSLQYWERYLEGPRKTTPTEHRTASHTSPEAIYEDDSLRLLHYRPQGAPKWVEPIVVCFALVNRPYILDLSGGRSVIERLLEQDFDVYLIDWTPPTDADHTRTLTDYICHSMNAVTDVVVERSTSPQVNLIGYCMGGTMATMYAALYPQRVRNLILMAAPIDFPRDDGLLNLWAQPEYFDVDRFIDAYGNCPGWFLQSCFQLMKPVQNYIEKYLNLCDKLESDATLENFFAMERWANDSVPVAGETFRDFVKLCYQQNQLVTGGIELNGSRVELESIRCPVLMLTADRDHLVPPQSSLALKQHVGSNEFDSMSVDAGHIGLAVSTKAHQVLWPRAAQWIAGHSTQME